MLAIGQAPSEPPAANRRPNLQVLTTVPESQLFPMMNAIADSLGVRCDHCHVRVSPDPTKTWFFAGGWVWDRDDKQPKRVAREMMRMVLDLNARQFGGRTVVTCYTCHRGAMAPESIPAAAAARLRDHPGRAFADAACSRRRVECVCWGRWRAGARFLDDDLDCHGRP